MQVAIASGKGGTGKTTVAVSLAAYLSRYYSVELIDSDVEEPNTRLFINPQVHSVKKVSTMIPVIERDRCMGCGGCVKICAFNCLALVNDKPLFFQEMCHSCGGCILVCKGQAIFEGSKEIGEITEGKAGGVTWKEGTLKIGEAMAPPLIRALLSKKEGLDITIVDAPPGTTCPVAASVQGSDIVLLVTEPTPFGLHDLKLAWELMEGMGMICGVIINRSGPHDNEVESFCREKDLPVIARIPHSRHVAEAYAKGAVVEALVKFYASDLQEIARFILQYNQEAATCRK